MHLERLHGRLAAQCVVSWSPSLSSAPAISPTRARRPSPRRVGAPASSPSPSAAVCPAASPDCACRAGAGLWPGAGDERGACPHSTSLRLPAPPRCRRPAACAMPKNASRERSRRQRPRASGAPSTGSELPLHGRPSVHAAVRPWEACCGHRRSVWRARGSEPVGASGTDGSGFVLGLRHEDGQQQGPGTGGRRVFAREGEGAGSYRSAFCPARVCAEAANRAG